MQQLPTAFNAMSEFKSWLLFKKIWDEKKQKYNKIPINPHTGNAYAKGAKWQQDPEAVTGANEAIAKALELGDAYGVGFLFTDKTPFFFVDIDNCADASTSNGWSHVANDILSMLPGAAVEVSTSGKGLHIFAKGDVKPHGCRYDALGLEFYTEGRFVALTGEVIGDSALDLTLNINAVVDKYFPVKAHIADQEWTTEAIPGWNGINDDETLLSKMLSSKGGAAAIFGNKCTIKDLWDKNEEKLEECYPDPTAVNPYNSSAVDAALAQHLTFWTGNNCERVLKLMQMSELKRDKWDREDYLERTILKAASMQIDFYGAESVEAESKPSIEEGPQIVGGWQYMAETQQVSHFDGCVYLSSDHRIYMPDGEMLKPEQFNVILGGFDFKFDDQKGKCTKKAFEAFTESQVVKYPHAYSICFRPTEPSGNILDIDGRKFVNSYIPVDVKRVKGDATPFTKHLEKVLPVESDRDILLAFMAACVQHKGVKFQWCPLIQGAEGNGKTLFSRCVEQAVGVRYTHWPRASEITEKFNAWLFNKLFIAVEDIHVSESKKEVMDVLKPMVTNDKLEERAMQKSGVMRDNLANLIMNSNFKDAVRSHIGDRRFSVFFSAQQTPADIERDGMGGDYFPDLYNWLKREDGYAIVSEFLHTYAIPAELNPTGALHRAPATSSTLEAITASLGGVEQEVLEAIGEGRPGFCGGWVSSVALDRLLSNIKANKLVAPNKRREMMVSIGYDWHPNLTDGRSSQALGIDEGKRPRLFIKDGHILRNLETSAEIIKAYQDAQSAGPDLGRDVSDVFGG